MLCLCFVDREKAYDREPRKVFEWAMRNKGIPDTLVRSVMSLHEGAMTWPKMHYELSEEFEVKAGLTKDLCFLLFFLHWW